MKDTKGNNKSIEGFWEFNKLWKTLLISIVIGIVVGLALQYVSEKNIKDVWGLLIKSFFSGLLTFMFIRIPTYLADTQDYLRKEIVNAMSKIDECPRMIALHTEGRVLEKQISKMGESEKSNVRWIMSKYISKLLSVSFKSFSIDFKSTGDNIDDTKATAEYSKFSSEIIKECKESVKLTGSMTPYEWLSNLAEDKDNQKRFFNNEIPELIIDENNNHSTILRNCQIPEKKRVVCLSKFDYDNLFLFENSIEAYYKINDGIPTRFICWDENSHHYKYMKPLQFEYALYDNTLLFKFDKETKVLEIKSEGEEFEEILNFFSKREYLIQADNQNEKDKLIKESHRQKQRLLKDIVLNKQIPHKYSYLFNDEWEKFLKQSERYSSNAKNAIGEAITHLLNIKNGNIIEIGAGHGDKIDLVCDNIGTGNINEYQLIDISSRLLREARTVLDRRIRNREERNCDLVIDVCDENLESDIFEGKIVLILNNSTIFTEKYFPWKQLKHAETILITLDLFENNANELFEEYYKARELFLSPLKIFEIPIVMELFEEEFKFLFSDNSKDGNCLDDTPLYNIYFNLKAYLDIITLRENQRSAREIAQMISNEGSSAFNEICDCITKYRRTHPPLGRWKKDTDQEYARQCECLYNIDKLIILSSLKFRKETTDDKIKAYFSDQNRFGGQFDINIGHFKHGSSEYVGICLMHKPNNGFKHQDSSHSYGSGAYSNGHKSKDKSDKKSNTPKRKRK